MILKEMTENKLPSATSHINHLETALQDARLQADKTRLSEALTQLGVLQIDTGQPAKAVSRLEQALGIALSTADWVRAMNLAGKLGDIFLKLESPEKALEYASLACDFAEKLGQLWLLGKKR